MSNTKKPFTAKKLKVIELLAIGELSNIEVCEQCGIAERTLYTWKKDPRFVEAVISRSREMIQNQLPEIYSSLKKRCVNGSAQHMKILFDHLDKLTEMQSAITSNQIIITWQDSHTDNEPQD